MPGTRLPTGSFPPVVDPGSTTTAGARPQARPREGSLGHRLLNIVGEKMGGSDKIPLGPQARDDLAEFIDGAIVHGLSATVNALRDEDARSGRVFRMLGGVILGLSFALLSVVSWTQSQRLDKIESAVTSHAGTYSDASEAQAARQAELEERQAELEKNQQALARHAVALTEATNTNAGRNHTILLVLVDKLGAEEDVPEDAKTLVKIEPSVGLRYLAGER